MTIFFHELKRGRTALLVWSLSISLMIFICMLMYPEMKTQVDEMNDMFSSLGGFTAAFGLDKINFGEPLGFYGVEAGNILAIGGGFFAALIGIGALANEEKNRTAEFLLTHPIRRAQIVCEKLLAMFTQILLLNIIVVAIAIGSFFIIGEDILWREFLLLHIAYFIMQIQVASICFGLSAFLSRSGLGIGLGLAGLLYFLSIIANISDRASFLRFITPFSYADAATIISESQIDPVLIGVGIVLSVIAVVLSFWRYNNKDIAS